MTKKELLRRINHENLGRVTAAGVCGLVLLLLGYCNRSGADAAAAKDAPNKTYAMPARTNSVIKPSRTR